MRAQNIKTKSVSAMALSVLQLVAVIALVGIYIAAGVLYAIFLPERANAAMIIATSVYVCAFMTYYSVRRIATVKTARAITRMAQNYGGRVPINEAATRLGIPVKRIYKDLGRIFGLRYIASASIDMERREIVFDNAWQPQGQPEYGTVLSQSNMWSVAPIVAFVGVWMNAATFLDLSVTADLAVAAVVSVALPLIMFIALPRCKKLVETEIKPEPVQPYRTGDADIDEKMNEAAGHIAELGRLAKLLASSEIGARLNVVSGIAQEILQHLKDHPEKIKNSRQFMNLYLPSSINVFSEYAALSAQPVKTSNIIAALKRIDEFSGRAVLIFRSELDNLYMDKAVDISAEISVMEAMVPGADIMAAAAEAPAAGTAPAGPKAAAAAPTGAKAAAAAPAPRAAAPAEPKAAAAAPTGAKAAAPAPAPRAAAAPAPAARAAAAPAATAPASNNTPAAASEAPWDRVSAPRMPSKPAAPARAVAPAPAASKTLAPGTAYAAAKASAANKAPAAATSEAPWDKVTAPQMPIKPAAPAGAVRPAPAASKTLAPGTAYAAAKASAANKAHAGAAAAAAPQTGSNAPWDTATAPQTAAKAPAGPTAPREGDSRAANATAGSGSIK
ncbi:MAG: 5-bromo-4-chloroindolyl phosphate hydrolysis family protein [Clostridiales Family XIII bacterium]|jgi:5-bromo-4-chloroindolyl phosphate hydrolysis protein|nr:5-bromo-4-chloroindolyl phosphate hydrolysis family protein [Clostridiales Family XIII bacterium]